MAKSIPVVFMRTEFNYDRDLVSSEAGLACMDATRAQQHAKEECDINNIVKRFGVTGMLPASSRLPTYGDFVGVSDYHTALEALREADDTFASLPSNVRAKFKNDAGAFVEFCSDPANLPELREMGLAPPLPSPAPDAPADAPKV